MMPLRRPALVAVLVAQPLMAVEHVLVRNRLTMQHAQAPEATPSTKAPPEGVPLLKKLEDLNTQVQEVCLSVNEHSQFGGLPETLGIVNSVLRYSLQHAGVVTFSMPEIRPPARQSMDDYRWMFGEPEVADTRWATMYIAVCPFSADTDSAVSEGCSLDETAVYQNTVYLMPRKGPGCHAYVMVSSRIKADYDYSVTGPLFSEMYWRRQMELGKHETSGLPFPMPFPISTAVHLLGDAEGTGDEYEHIIGAFTSKIDPKCLRVELYTNSTASHAAVQAVMSSWKTKGVDEVQIFDSGAKETEKFDRMASASILMGGADGFATLAAVLGKASVKIFVNDAPNSHPTGDVQGITTFRRHEFDRPAVEASLAVNRNMNQVIEGCRLWLGK